MEPKDIAASFYDALYPIAAKIVATGREHAAMFHALRRDGRVLSKLVAQLNPQDKEDIAALHRAAAALPDTLAVCLLMECWMTKVTAGPSGDALVNAGEDGRVRVRDVPGRGEGLVFNIRAGAQQYLATCEIDRATGALTKGELFDVSGSDGVNSATGRFIGGACAATCLPRGKGASNESVH